MAQNINLDTLTVAQGFLAVATTGAPNSGYSVSNAGDVNGDGCDDILIGTPYSVVIGSTEIGRAYVVYGGAISPSTIVLENLTVAQGFSIVGANVYDYFASAVSGAGDINKDGYGDIIILAPYANSNAGKAYVIYGGISHPSTINVTTLTVAQGFSIVGANVYANFGFAVSGAGDVNGDGYDDVIIGGYVIYGGATFPSAINVTSLTAAQGFSITPLYFNSVSGAGDVNRDGYADIIIGDSSLQKSYVIYGGANLPSTMDVKSLTAEQGFSILAVSSKSYQGYSVSGAGDVNRDGYADVIIGDPNVGNSYVLYGGTALLSTVDLSNLGAQGFYIIGHSKDLSGYSVSEAGDVNKDGYADVIIGAPEANSYSGESYVVYGGNNLQNIVLSSLTTTQGFSISTSRSGGSVGHSVNGGGDVNKDGYADVIIGAPGTSASYVIYGSSSTDLSSSAPLTQWWNELEFKVAVSLGSPVLSFIAGWFFREKIAFHVLSNWGFDYELIYSDNKMPLPAAKVGFRLLKQKSTGVDKLVCKIKGKYMNVEIDNGNNKGISEGLYNTIIDKLKQPHQSEPFVFLQSEKNQIRDFLFSRSGFVNAGDLGCIKGTIYRLCMNSNYKRKHEEKYQYEIRVEDAERFSGINDDDIQREINSPMNPSISMIQLNEQSIKETKDLEKLDAVDSITSTNNRGCVVMSIDAMMDPEHVRLQNEAFERFGQALIDATKELLMIKQGQVSREDNQAVAVYQDPAAPESIQFSSSDNLMISLLSARQIVEYLPLMKHVMQSIINYLGYNITLPEVLDNKAILTTTHLILGYTAAQYLPAEMVMNGMVVSTISTGSYAVRLVVADYLKEQSSADGPVELTKTCGVTMLAYTLSGAINCAMTKLILPDASCSFTGYDALASGSLGAIECYSNYKATVHPVEPTTADVVLPYIADAAILLMLGRNLQPDSINPAMLMLSIKSSISVAATVYATDCVARMVMEVVPQEVKDEYIDPVFDYACNTLSDITNTCYQAATDVGAYINQEANLVMDYLGAMNLRGDA